jgi:uncharacterized membrane protein
MVAATLALAGFFVALYLWLWKLGVVGSLVCGPGGSCEYVQSSPQSVFLGVPVALVGVVGYLAVFVIGLTGAQPRWAERRGPTIVLAILSGVGVLFSAYLTYLEAAVLHAWCRWCLGSAGIISAIFVVSLVGMIRGRMDG